MTQRADLVVVGRIATLAGERGPGWVEAIAISRGRVVAAGSLSDVDGVSGPGTRRRTLADDEVAVPGLTDAHLHLAEAALAATQVALEGCRSIDELIERVRATAMARDGGWIEGGGWNPDLLGRWPTAADLELGGARAAGRPLGPRPPRAARERMPRWPTPGSTTAWPTRRAG